MYDNSSKNVSYIAGFFILIAFCIAGQMISLLIAKPLWVAMTNEEFQLFIDGVLDPAYAGAYKAIQAVNAIFGYLLPAILTAFLLNYRPYHLMGFKMPIKAPQAGLVVLIMLVALVVSAALSYFNNAIPIPDDWREYFDKLESQYNKQAEAILSLNSVSDYVLALVVMAFLPALCEEALFRGGLQNFLTRSTNKAIISIIVVSLLFSVAHFSYYGFLSRFFLSIVIGMIYYYSGSLWLAVLAHFLNNALSVTVLYYYKSQGKSITEAIAATNDSWWSIFALPLLIGLLIVFRKYSHRNQQVVFQENKNTRQENTGTGFIK